MTQTTRQRGQLGEQLALNFLRMHGLRLVQRNYRCKLGEIDLILVDRPTRRGRQKTLVFVEVRYRQTSDYGGAAATVTKGKQSRIIRTAEVFRRQHKQHSDKPARFDVVAIRGSLVCPRITWLKAAFDCA